jgi:hypothetical protein
MKEKILHWLVIAVGCVFAVAAVLAISNARAAELTPEQARGIYYVAYGQYHGPREWLEQMPVIHIVSPADLCARQNLPPDCPIKATYLPGHVYASSTLDFSDPFHASILLHELVHHMQQLKNGPARNCLEALRREHEAYMIQSDVLMKSGLGTEAFGVRMTARQLHCTPEEGG